MSECVPREFFTRFLLSLLLPTQKAWAGTACPRQGFFAQEGREKKDLQTAGFLLAGGMATTGTALLGNGGGSGFFFTHDDWKGEGALFVGDKGCLVTLRKGRV